MFNNKNILILGPGKSTINIDFNKYDYIIIFNEMVDYLRNNIIPNNNNIILFANGTMLEDGIDRIERNSQYLYKVLYKIYYNINESKYNNIRSLLIPVERGWSKNELSEVPLGIFYVLKYFLQFSNINIYISNITFYKNGHYDDKINLNRIQPFNAHGGHNIMLQIEIFKQWVKKYKNIILLDDILKDLLNI
tara:strand:- start:10405 stop:10980 length:576 start_codon:yes stop_codon:yes gene_type:complete